MTRTLARLLGLTERDETLAREESKRHHPAYEAAHDRLVRIVRVERRPFDWAVDGDL